MKPPKNPISFNQHVEKKRSEEQNQAFLDFAAEYSKANEQANFAKENFLTAWKRGVLKIGVEFFNLKCGIHEVKEKWQACPNFEFINQTILNKSHGQQTLLALMYSFYDPIEGQKLLEKIGSPNWIDARGSLDDEGVEIIGQLWMYYSGW